MDKILESMKERGDADELAQEEVSLECQQFPDNQVKAGDWKILFEQKKDCKAVSLVECGLQKIEAPSDEYKQLEVIDIGSNKQFDGNLDFTLKFPNLISITLNDLPNLSTMAQLEVLKKLPELKVIECSDDMLFGFKDQDELRAAIFKEFPGLFGMNGLDAAGMSIDPELEEEDLMFEDDFLDDEDDEDDDDVVDDDESPEEEGGEEPATKRRKEDTEAGDGEAGDAA